MRLLAILGTWMTGPREETRGGESLSSFHTSSDASEDSIALVRMKDGERGRIISVGGGPRAERSLAQLHIRVGSSLRLVRAAPWGGPVLVETDGGTVAVGKNLAAKVKVRVER